MAFFTVVLAMVLAVSLRWPDVQAQDCKEVTLLEEDFDDLAARVDRLNNELKSYRTALTKLKATESSITDLTNMVNSLTDQLQETEGSFSAIQQQFGAVNASLVHHQAALSALESQCTAEVEGMKRRQQGLQETLRESIDQLDYELYDQKQHFNATLESNFLEQRDAQYVLRQEFEAMKTASEEREAAAEEQKEQLIADAQAVLRDTSQEDRVRGLDELIAGLQSQIEALDQQKIEHHNGMQSIERSVQNKTQEIGDLDNRLQAQQQAQDSLEGDVQLLEGDVANLEAATQNLQEQGTEISGQLETQATLLDEQEQRQGTIQVAMDELAETFRQGNEAMDQRLTQAETRITALEANGESVRESITTIESDVQSLSGSVNTVEQQVDGQDEALQTLQGNVDSLTAQLETINDSLQQAEQQQEGLQQSYEGLQQEVQQQENRTEARMQTIESGLTGQGSSEGDVLEGLVSLQTTAAGLQTTLSGMNNQGTGFLTEVQTTQQSIANYDQRIQGVEAALEDANPQALQQEISGYVASSAQRFGTVEASLVAMTTSLTAVQSEIDQLEETAGSVSGLSSQITQLNTQAQSNTQTLTATQASIQQLQNHYQTLSDQSEVLEADVTRLETGYQEAMTQLADLASNQDINEVLARITELDTAVDGLETEVQTMETGSETFETELRDDVDEITETVEEQGTTLAQLESNAGGDLSTTVASLRSDVSGISTTASHLTSRLNSAEASMANWRNVNCESGLKLLPWQGFATSTREYVGFTRTYSQVPSVVPSITKIDSWASANDRLDVYTESVTTRGFYMIITSWADTWVYGASARYFVFGTV
ncbi:uncharacterized protein LOC144908177 [Branchiostoma floridae x Branchiostoma belcheri]